MPTRIDISPEKIIWAAERGGISIEKLLDIYPKARDWINKKKSPTVRQLEDFSKKVHVPFGFLFLQNPPNEEMPITFYRSNGSVINNPPLVVRDIVNDIKRKQEWLSDFLVDNNYNKLDFVSILKDYKNLSPQSAAQEIRSKIKLNKTWYEEIKNKDAAFSYWVKEIEKNRIFVISTGYFGHAQRKIDVETCKGFTLIDDYCPFIYINTNNLGGGRIFTLIHELVHIFVGSSIGIGYDPIKPSSKPLEKFCDSVASEILVPQDFFEVSWKSHGKTSREKFIKLSRLFQVSQLVIARKALDSGFIQQSDFWDFFNSYAKSFPSKNNRGNFWNSKPYSVSRRFYTYVDSALKQGKILPARAYKLTSMKGKTYEKFKNYI